MANCVFCSTKLSILNKPIGGRLNDGNSICISCYNKLSKSDSQISFNLKKYSSEDIILILSEAKEKSKNIISTEKLLEPIDCDKPKQETIIDKENKNMNDIIVTTGDLKQAYEVIGPVYFQISNKGLFSNAIKRLSQKYAAELQEMKKAGLANKEKADWGWLYGEYSFGLQNDFDKAFYISVKQLQQRASILGADAVIGMRQDIDMDTNHFQYFYLQMYGTAIKFIE